MTVVVLDLGNIFHFLFDGAGVNSRYRGVMATTLFLSSTALETSLIVLVLLRVGGGSLLSRRWLFLTRCVSKSGVDGLNLSRILLLLFRKDVPSGAPKVHLASAWKQLEYCFCLCIDDFFHNLFLGVQVPVSGIQLGPNRRSQAFPKASDYNRFIRSGSGVKLLENCLQLLQVGCPVKNFL